MWLWIFLTLFFLISVVSTTIVFYSLRRINQYEEILIQLANSFRKKGNDNIIIIIVPRHINRSESIQMTIKNAGYDIRCRSKNELPNKIDYFSLADTIGGWDL